MTVSVVLSLVQERLRQGEVVGRAHCVDTGEERLVTSVGDLLRVLCEWGTPNASG